MKSLRSKTVSGLFVLVVAFFISTAGHATGVNHVVVFGDSLSDNGNMLAQTSGVFPTAPAYYFGRQTNGLVWNETLAFDIGASLTNFAVAGAQTGTGNVWDGGPFPGSPYGGLQNQIADYASGTMDSDALHVVWAGSNNFLSIPSDPVAAIGQAVTEIVTAVGTLAGSGMTKIWVINLPDFGLTPRLIDAGLSAEGTALTNGFNAALAGGLMSAGLGGIPIYDAAGLMRDIVAAPGDYGLTNVTEACIDPLDPLAPGSCLAEWSLDSDKYMFWDDIHPTRAVHNIFADEIRHAAWIPVPAAVWLFASALGLLGWVRYRAA